MGLDQGDVGVDRKFQHVIAAVDAARLAVPSQKRAVAGWAVEGADAGAGGADALGEIALRHDLQLDLAGAIEPIEDPGIGLARERAEHLAHAPAP